MDFVPQNRDYQVFAAAVGEETYWESGNWNLFMICRQPNPVAFRPMATGWTFRLCHPDEKEIWKGLAVEEPFIPDVTAYYNRVYAPREAEFMRSCYFLCNPEGKPVATGLLWKAWKKVSSLGWIRTLPEEEGKGCGRMLLSCLLERAEYPLFLHTQPTSARAIKLYSDFGFQLITDPVVGYVPNDLQRSLPLLQKVLPPQDFACLKMTDAPADFLNTARSSPVSEL